MEGGNEASARQAGGPGGADEGEWASWFEQAVQGTDISYLLGVYLGLVEAGHIGILQRQRSKASARSFLLDHL